MYVPNYCCTIFKTIFLEVPAGYRQFTEKQYLTPLFHCDTRPMKHLHHRTNVGVYIGRVYVETGLIGVLLYSQLKHNYE